MNLPYHKLALLALPAVWLCTGTVWAQHQLTDLGRSHLPMDGDTTLAVVIADLAGDGHADVIAGNGGLRPEQNRVYRNDGTGGFADVTASSLPTVLDLTNALVVADLDGDGDLDLVVGNSGPNRLLLNDGRGRMVDATNNNLPVANDTTLALALADVDGDGDLDLLCMNDGQNRLLLNNGRALFTDVTASLMPVDNARSAGVAVGDLDRDGDPDIVVANAGAGGALNFLYRNEGGGRFTNATSNRLPLLMDDSRGVAIADFNGDRNLDILVANHGTSRYFINVGQMRFQDVTIGNLPTRSAQSEALRAEDVDQDGDVDVVLAELGGPELWLNSGRGGFTRATGTRMLPTAIPLHALAWHDLDGDQDPDLVFGVAARGNLLYLNLYRQIDGAAPARGGQGYQLDFYSMPGFAPQNQLVATYASVGLAQRPFRLPPLGEFRLDLSTLIVGKLRPLPAGAGTGSVVYAVPRGMAGMTVHLQSLFLHGANALDWRFSNVVRVAIQ